MPRLLQKTLKGFSFINGKSHTIMGEKGEKSDGNLRKNYLFFFVKDNLKILVFHHT